VPGVGRVQVIDIEEHQNVGDTELRISAGLAAGLCAQTHIGL
jgi:hypothetical protein